MWFIFDSTVEVSSHIITNSTTTMCTSFQRCTLVSLFFFQVWLNGGSTKPSQTISVRVPATGNTGRCLEEVIRLMFPHQRGPETDLKLFFHLQSGPKRSVEFAENSVGVFGSLLRRKHTDQLHNDLHGVEQPRRLALLREQRRQSLGSLSALVFFTAEHAPHRKVERTFSPFWLDRQQEVANLTFLYLYWL